jgi:hypothetical protein
LARFRRNVGVGYGSFWRGVIFDTEYKNLADIITQSKRMFRLFNDGAISVICERIAMGMAYWRGAALPLRQRGRRLLGFHGQEFPFIGFNELTKQQSRILRNDVLLPALIVQAGELPAGEWQVLKPIPLETFSTTNPFGIGILGEETLH